MKAASPISLSATSLRSALLLLPLIIAAGACGSEAPPPVIINNASGSQSSAGSAAQATSGGGGAAAAPSGAAGAVADGGTGVTPSAGASAFGGVGASSPGGATAGVSASGAAGGGIASGGTASGGGSAGAPLDLLATVGGPLNGQMLLGPCLANSATSVCQTINGACPGANSSDPALSGVITTDHKLTLGGDSSKTYTITLHVQGEVESKRYTGGKDQEGQATSPKMDGFCVGGTPAGGDSYNVYMLRVGSPKNDYFFNSLQTPGVSNHTTYGLDYTAKIRANGGSELRLIAADANCSMIKNCGPMENDGSVCAGPITLANVDPQAKAKNPSFAFDKAYNGQWVVMVVTAVTVD